MPDREKRWDVLSVGRLDVRLKRYDELGAVSDRLSVAVAGTGPDAAWLQARYPRIEWLGAVPNDEMPAVMSGARIFAHAGRREFFPRVVAEASACGLPVVALAEAIAADVVPDDCGMRVDLDEFAEALVALAADSVRREKLGRRARIHAEQEYGLPALRASVEAMLERVIRVER